MKELRARAIIGNADVDVWTRKDWQAAVAETFFLVTTPQLFLEALDAEKLELSAFCVLVVDGCQHCAGSHPLGKIFSKHYSQTHTRGAIRVLGLSENRAGRSVKYGRDPEAALNKLQKLMASKIVKFGQV